MRSFSRSSVPPRARTRLRLSVVLLTLAGAVIAEVAAGESPLAYSDYLFELYEDTVPVATPSELERARASNRTLVLLDVRSRAERSVSYIAGSEFHDYDGFSTQSFLDLPRSAPIIIYCAVGYRSERVGEMFLEHGFTDVRHLYGGIIEWSNRGLPLERGSSQSSSSDRPPVHGYLPQWGRYVTTGEVVYDPPVEH